MNSLNPSTAVVIGAGMGGLMAARALSRHFKSIVVVEPDELPEGPGPRKATPQSGHVHAILKSGEGVLSDFYPGFKDALRKAGGHEFAVRSQWRTWTSNGWVAPIDTGLKTLSLTRMLLEHLVRERTFGDATVQLLQGKALGFRVERDGIRAVEVGTDAGLQLIPCALVVDAAGRGGRTLAWLKKLGVEAPPEEKIAPEICYTSTFFTRSISSGPDFGGWLMFPQPPHTRGAVALPVEDGRWLVTAFDRFGRKVPDQELGFRRFLSELPDRKFTDLLSAETLDGEFRSYRIAEVRLRRFDLVADALPKGYLPIGDAIGTFNPIYAQGISVAALQAKALDEALRECGREPGWRSRVAIAYLSAAMQPALWAWRLGQATDLAYDQVQGRRTEESAAFASTVRAVLARSSGCPSLMAAHAKVVHLLAPPDCLAEALDRHLLAT